MSNIYNYVTLKNKNITAKIEAAQTVQRAPNQIINRAIIINITINSSSNTTQNAKK